MGKIKAILGDNIRRLRTNKGWTQVYLADRLQITAPFLAQIESGKRGTSLEVIESIADIFDIPIAFLFLEQAGFPIKMQPTIRTIELRAIEKQLQEAIAENISFAFKKLI